MSTPTHPLARLTAAEIEAAVAIIKDASLVTETTRFAYLGLDEPSKAEVLAHTPGAPFDRRIKALLLDLATGATQYAFVSLTNGKVERVERVDTRTQGQAPILDDDFAAVEEIVKADPGWVEAMARRGLTDLDLIRPCPLS